MNITNAIQIAVAFVKTQESLASASPSYTSLIDKNAADSTKVYSYWDSYGKVWTIGWGSTYYQNGSRVGQNDIITKKQADDLILWQMTQKEKELHSKVPLNLVNENQYAALLSIAYNAGTTGLVSNSQIVTTIKSGASPQQVAAVIQDSLVHSGGVFLQGLANRRAKESQLYLSPVSIGAFAATNKIINYSIIGLVLVGIGAYLYYLKKKKVI